MDDNEDFESFEQFMASAQSELPAAKIRAIDLVIVGTTFLTNIANAVHTAFDNLDDRLRMHANYRREQDDFAAEVGMTIEKIAGGEDG